MCGRLIAALGVVDGAGMRVCALVQVGIGCFIPPLEVGVTTLGSGIHRVTDGVGVAVRSVLIYCGQSLDSQTTLGDGASVGSSLGTSLGD